MITLYGSGPHFGMPDPSPFVIKAVTLFRMAGIPYTPAEMSFGKAPKGKIPYMEEGGKLIGDSTFIRFYLEEKYGIDFNAGYNSIELAQGWAIERMLEEHFYWFVVHDRWCVERNFEAGPREFFNMAPAPIRPFIKAMVRRQVRKTLHAQGLGRHTDAERNRLGIADVNAVATLLGGKKYLLGSNPCGVDATVHASLWTASCPLFESVIGAHIRSHEKIMAYIERMCSEFHPGFASAKN